MLALSASSSAFLGQGIAPVSGAAGLTIVRIRGQLDIFLRSVTSVGDGFQCAFGIGLATAAAVAAGIASVPTPITEAADENWLFWHALSIHGNSAVEAEFHSGTHQRLMVDTKAMRKFEDGMIIYAAIEVVEIGTVTADVFFDSRALALIA